jgi:hypothetical protein
MMGLGINTASATSQVDHSAIVGRFERLRQSFPTLDIALDVSHPEVSVMLDVIPQPGIAFGMSGWLDGDELHLKAGHFHLEWFPCTEPEVAERYFDALEGLLQGRLRIVERYVGGTAVSARLQAPDKAGWRTLGRWGTPFAIIPWRSSWRELRNALGAAVRESRGTES